MMDDEDGAEAALPDPAGYAVAGDGDDAHEPRRRKDDGARWPRKAGVFENWRPPSWGADNSRRL